MIGNHDNRENLKNSFSHIPRDENGFIQYYTDIRDKKFIDLWWENEGFKMPLEIIFNSFDGKRERRLDLTNSPNRIAIPAHSELTLDPDRWLLYHQNIKN